MTYLVSARRWRPQTFDDLVGQEHVARTLSNAIRAGRVAHAFLFTGVRGVGKTTAARVLAKALNCERGPTPRTPVKRNACATLPARMALLNVRATCSWPTRSSKVCGRQRRADTRYVTSPLARRCGYQ